MFVDMPLTVAHEVEAIRRFGGPYVRNPSTHSGINLEPASNGKIRMRSPSSNAINVFILDLFLMELRDALPPPPLTLIDIVLKPYCVYGVKGHTYALVKRSPHLHPPRDIWGNWYWLVSKQRKCPLHGDIAFQYK